MATPRLCRGSGIAHSAITLSAVHKNNRIRWFDFIGHRIIKEIRLVNDGTVLDRYGNEEMEMYYRFHISDSQKPGWKKCVGQETSRHAMFLQDPEKQMVREQKFLFDGPQTPKQSHDELDLYIPLLFWYSIDPAFALSNWNITYEKLWVEIDFETVENCISVIDYAADGGKYTRPTIELCNLVTNHVYTTPEVAELFKHQTQFSIIRIHKRIEQIVNRPFDYINIGEIKFAVENLYFRFRPLANEYDSNAAEIWRYNDVSTYTEVRYPSIISTAGVTSLAYTPAYYYATSPAVDTVAIVSDGNTIYDSNPGLFYNAYIPMRFGGDRVLTPNDEGTYLLTFSLFPGKAQPSGYLNFSQTRDQYIPYSSSYITTDTPCTPSFDTMLAYSFDDLFTNLRVGSYNYGYMAQASFQLAHPVLGLVFQGRRDLDEVDKAEFIVTLDRILTFFRTPSGQLNFVDIDELKDATLTYLAASKGGVSNFHRYHYESTSTTPCSSARGRTRSRLRSSQLDNSDLKTLVDEQSARIANIERVAQHEIKQVTLKLGVVMNDNNELRDLVEDQGKVIEDMKYFINQQSTFIKKFQARQQTKFSQLCQKATLGDWGFSMILDGLNVVMEVRINDMESADVPKYDFVIDRVPFRRWDVYRRKKHAITTATYAQPNAPSGNAYGTHRWGPGGASPSSQSEPQPSRGSFTGSSRSSFTGSSRGSFTGNSPTSDRTQSFNSQGARPRTSSGQQNGRTRSFSGQQIGQQGFNSAQQYAGQRSSLQEQSAPFAPNTATTNSHQPPPAPPAPKPKKQPEINLIDDFGPSVSVSAQSLIFDPLASAKISSAGDSTAAAPVQQQQQQQQQQHQQPPPVTAIPQPTPYVDPFAAVAAPVMTKPAGSISLDPFAAHNGTYQQQPQQQQPNRPIPVSTMNQPPVYQQPMGMAMGGPMGGMPMQQQQQQQGMRGSFTGQQPGAPSGMGSVNYNISQLMNPASLHTSQQSQQGKSINIDAFASLSR
ncbi:hypothetical protein ON010_g2964 [Phytophthora cinnamomi]|nr:hypothetical protein ON010_g2964 [Phytophthora cinnamomi]